MSGELPPNWRAAKAEDGKEYFFNELTGETSWVPPGEPAEAKVAPLVSDGEAKDEGEVPPINIDVGDDPRAMESTESRPAAESGTGDPGDLRMMGRPSALAEGLGAANLPKLLVILVASFVVMLQASIEYRKQQTTFATSGRFPAGATAYAVSVSTISLALVLSLFAVARFKPALLGSAQIPLPKNLGALSVIQSCSLFLGVWWAIGVGILTFHTPYTVTSNAYFCCWACAFASLLLCHSAFTTVSGAWQRLTNAGESDTRVQHMAVLAACALTLFLASFDHVKTSQGAWAMACGVLSGCCIGTLAFLTVKKKLVPPIPKVLGVTQLLLWTFAAGVLTFDEPFKATSNGYFACWIGLMTSASIVYKEFFDQQIAWGDGFKRSFSIDASSAEMPSAVNRL